MAIFCLLELAWRHSDRALLVDMPCERLPCCADAELHAYTRLVLVPVPRLSLSGSWTGGRYVFISSVERRDFVLTITYDDLHTQNNFLPLFNCIHKPCRCTQRSVGATHTRVATCPASLQYQTHSQHSHSESLVSVVTTPVSLLCAIVALKRLLVVCASLWRRSNTRRVIPLLLLCS